MVHSGQWEGQPDGMVWDSQYLVGQESGEGDVPPVKGMRVEGCSGMGRNMASYSVKVEYYILEGGRWPGRGDSWESKEQRCSGTSAQFTPRGQVAFRE